MREDLKLDKRYDGFLFLADAARNPPILKSHHHAEMELNLVVRGTITYVVGRRRFTFRPRTLLWLFPAQEHQLVDRSDDAQCYVAVFKPSLIVRSCHTATYAGLKSRGKNQHGVLHTVLEPESFDLIRKVMQSLMRDSIDSDLLNREAGFGAESAFSFRHGDPDGLNAGLRHLLLLCWRSQRAEKSPGNPVALHPAVSKALQLLSDECEGHDLKYLAHTCGVSESYLSRTFRRQIGVPLSRYRNSSRLSRFWEHYRRQPQQKTLAEAVYAAGFGSYAQFYKIFTQAYGSGPRTACIIPGI